MAVAISFNDKKITDQLDTYTKTQLPWIATLTLNGLAAQLKKDLQHEMVDSFTYLKATTYNSIKHKPADVRRIKTNHTDYAEIYHRDRAAKGTSPAQYLKPLITGGPVHLTRFQRRLEGKGILNSSFGRYMQPLHDAPGVDLSPEGRLKHTEYIKALWGIRAMEDIRSSGKYGKKDYKTSGSYKWVPPNVEKVAREYAKSLRILSKKTTGKWSLPTNSQGKTVSGIYRVGGGGFTQVFKQLERVPNVQKDHYLFSLTGETSVKENYARIFRQKVKEVIR